MQDDFTEVYLTQDRLTYTKDLSELVQQYEQNYPVNEGDNFADLESEFRNAKQIVNQRMNHLPDIYVRQIAKYLDVPDFDTKNIEEIRNITANLAANIKLNKLHATTYTSPNENLDKTAQPISLRRRYANAARGFNALQK